MGQGRKQGLGKGEEKPHKHPHLLCSHIRLPLLVCVTHGSDDWEKVIHTVIPEPCRWQVQTHDPAELPVSLIPNAFNTTCPHLPRVIYVRSKGGCHVEALRLHLVWDEASSR